jgi:hypothetical protein
MVRAARGGQPLPKTPEPIRIIGAFAFALVATTGRSAEWSVESSVSARGLYDSNIALTTGPHNSVTGGSLAPKVTFGYDTELATVSGSGTVDVQRYSESGLDTTDVLLRLAGHRKLERASYGLTLDYVKDTTLESELRETGQVVGRKQRRSFNLSPDALWQVSERTDATVGFRYSDVRYQDASAGGYVDYRYPAVFSTLLYRLSPRDEVTGRLSLSRYDPSTPSLPHNDTTLKGEYTVLFSETQRGAFSLGIAHLSGAALQGGGTNRIVGRASISQSFENGSLGFSLSQEINPTGSGSLAQVDRAAIELVTQLRETISLYLAGAIYRTRFVASAPNSSNSEYYQLASRLTWDLARDWSLAAGYSYQNLKYFATPSAATGNTVYVTLAYRWPRQSASR